jgi:hypothetical protein
MHPLRHDISYNWERGASLRGIIATAAPNETNGASRSGAPNR